MPAVIQRQKAYSYKAVFMQLFLRSDQDGFIELDAKAISQAIGFSRNTVYKAIQFLKRVNLLILKISRTGRGNHSLFYVNWRKPGRKCQPHISKTKDINHIHDQRVQRPDYIKSPWNQKMRAFRKLFEHSWLLPTEKEACLKLIGKQLKRLSRDEALGLYQQLARIVHKLDVPNWVLEIKQLYAWFGSVLKRIQYG